jgi:hypothetical protein
MIKSGYLTAKVKQWLGYILLLNLSIFPIHDVFLLPSIVIAAEEPAFAELIAPKDSMPWIGQRIDFAVEVAVEGRFNGSTLFDLPEVDGAILMKPEERPVLLTRTRNNKEYSVQRHEFSLFFQQGGDIAVPEIHVRCGSIKSVGASPGQHTLIIPSFNVTPRVPEGAKPGQIVVSTTNLEVSETWRPPPGDAKVGDAFRRTVTLQATDVPGMLLPRIPKPQLEGMAVYTSEPEVTDQTERGEFTGTRADTLTFVCERPGRMEFPPILYRWWNPEKSVWEEKSLPAVTFRVAPNPNYASTAPDGTAHAESETQGLPFLWAFVLAVAVFVCTWMLRRRKPSAEAQAFKEALRACRNNNAAGAYNAVTRWRSLVGSPAAIPPAEVASELTSAQRVMVGLEPSWNGQRLEKLFKSWRRSARRGEIIASQALTLPELNPGR